MATKSKISTEDWIEELKGISVLELSERIKALEEEFDVSATAVAAAAPAAAGIPLTHRGLARSFAVVTASTAHAEDTVDLARMATATDTLVVLMASGKLAETCLTLIDAGRPPSTPAAIVQWAWTEDQRTITGSLADLPTLAAAANVGPPATLVVGDVVSVGSHRGRDRARRDLHSANAPRPFTR